MIGLEIVVRQVYLFAEVLPEGLCRNLRAN